MDMNSSTPSWFVLTLCLVVSLLSVGCGSRYGDLPSRTDPCHGQDCEAGQSQSGCTSDLDCTASTSCVGGSCVETSPPGNSNDCQAHNDCPVGQFCDLAQSSCVQCLLDDHCSPGEVCQSNGTCGSDQGCTRDSECNTGLVCEPTSGECVGCTQSSHCPSGQTCVDQTCVPDSSNGISCTTQSDCDPYGRLCDFTSGLCVEAQCRTASDCQAPLGCRQGYCAPCQSSNECRPGETCNAGSCEASPPAASARLGEFCATASSCSSGLTCISLGSSQLCSRSCIGSGQGNGADCPSNFACYKFNTDTFALCLPNAVMLDAAGQSLPGSPYNLQPGASCAAGNGCQTLHCDSNTYQCLRQCAADRDCSAGEVCYTAWIPKEAPGTGDEIVDVHYCIATDTVNFQGVGGACTSGAQCDTGLCEGTCSDNPTRLCNSGEDCPGASCTGTCTRHCRSTADCASNQTCSAWPTTAAGANYSGWTSTCQAKFGTGTTPNGGSCSASAQCASDWCVGGFCSTPCANNSDCNGALVGRTCKITSVGDGEGNRVYSTQFCR